MSDYSLELGWLVCNVCLVVSSTFGMGQCKASSPAWAWQASLAWGLGKHQVASDSRQRSLQSPCNMICLHSSRLAGKPCTMLSMLHACLHYILLASATRMRLVSWERLNPSLCLKAVSQPFYTHIRVGSVSELIAQATNATRSKRHEVEAVRCTRHIEG